MFIHSFSIAKYSILRTQIKEIFILVLCESCVFKMQSSFKISKSCSALKVDSGKKDSLLFLRESYCDSIVAMALQNIIFENKFSIAIFPFESGSL